MPKPFNRVAGLNPGRSVFDLSYEKKFTCDMGQLIPIVCDEVVPGDVLSFGNQIVVRFQPLVAPMLHEVNVYVHYFFVPYRLLMNDWEDFLSGGVNGDKSLPLPRWTVTDQDIAAGATAIGSIWDYIGMPVGVNYKTGTPQAENAPIDFPRSAYNFVYNEYYRDENLQDEVDLKNNKILNRNWEKDYFTSALPWQQRGVAPAFPLSGTASAKFVGYDGKGFEGLVTGTVVNSADHNCWLRTDIGVSNDARNAIFTPVGPNLGPGYATMVFDSTFQHYANKNEISLENVATFNVADLRLVFQIQKWLERNARAGVRYTEFLRAHFGVAPRDERLQRPEYIGGMKTPCVVSEVLQTSETSATQPTGKLAGKGISVDGQFCGKYRVTEFGLVIAMMSVMPRTSYQQGINRQWLKQTKYDFYFPEFANLSEQAVTNQELYAQANAEDVKIFGYQGRYDELRVKQSLVCGQMRNTFDYWHLGRKFDNQPKLNSDFITCKPAKRIYAVQNEPGLIVSVANLIKAVRPLPIQAQPGLIDHN
ncbi:major capsid protein [Microvirus D_HF6_206]|nr:major capsid protein [Microvirus D_HF6_206]